MKMIAAILVAFLLSGCGNVDAYLCKLMQSKEPECAQYNKRAVTPPALKTAEPPK